MYKNENNIAYEVTYLAPITSDIPFLLYIFCFLTVAEYMFVAHTHTHTHIPTQKVNFLVNLLLNLFLDASMVVLFLKIH